MIETRVAPEPWDEHHRALAAAVHLGVNRPANGSVKGTGCCAPTVETESATHARAAVIVIRTATSRPLGQRGGHTKPKVYRTRRVLRAPGLEQNGRASSDEPDPPPMRRSRR